MLVVVAHKFNRFQGGGLSLAIGSANIGSPRRARRQPDREVDAMAEIQWIRDPDQGLELARKQSKMALLDFSAAPM